MTKNYKMKTRLAIAFSCILSSFVAMAQVDVTATAGTATATYTTLGAAFSAINAGTHQGSINIAITASTTETATAVLNASGSGSALYTAVTVYPAASAAVSISGAITAGSPLIDLNGADNVVFDGLNTGGNSLTISNTTAASTSGTSTIRFIGGATLNTITHCTVLGSFSGSVGTNGGNIFFSTDALTANGNDNNSITLCDITSSPSGLTTKGIYGNGSTSTTAIGNSGNLISGNNIYDYFGAAVTSAGVYVAGGCTDWTITNNKFYQTATRTQTAGAQHSGIWITNTSGNNFIVTNNTIGYASNTGTGMYTFVGFSSSSVLVPIYLNVGTTTATSVQGNTVAGIAMSGAVSGTSSSAAFRGIYVSSGLTVVGDITGNTIGSQSSTGSITYTSTSSSTSDIIGIFNFGSSNWVSNNNTVGGITASNSSTGAANIYGIRCNTGSTVTWICMNNTVGGTVANSIQSTTTATGSVVDGILNSNPIGTFTGNIICNLTTAGGTGTGTTASISGLISSSSANQTMSGNTVHTLTGTGASNIIGISLTSGSTSNIFNNKIYNLESNNAGASVYGLSVSGGTTTTVYNNIIGDLRAPSSTNANDVVRGMSITGGTTVNVYYNTVRLNAVSSGANFSTSAIFTSTTPTVALANNIFINNSTQAGTGLTAAFRRSTTTLTSYATASNNNIFYAGTPSATNLIFYDGTNADQTLASFQTRVGPTRDATSRTENVPFVSTVGSSPSFLHVDTATPTFAESGGVNIATFTTDYDGDIRQGNAGYAGTGTAPDIGADEFGGTPVPQCAGTPPAASISGLTSVCSGTGTTLSLTGAGTDPGISYQWASSTTMGGPYTPMGTSLSQATGNLTSTTYYIVTSTCSFSGLSASTPEYTVNINANPSITVTPNTSTFCSGGSPVALTASGGTSFAWSPSAGLSGTTGANVNANPSSGTTFTVTGTDVNGCTGTATSAITVNETPSISAVTATPASVCSGGNSQLNVTAGTTASYTLSSPAFSPASCPANAGPTGDDAIQGGNLIGFNFTFFGISYNKFAISTNGNIQLGDGSGSAGNPAYSNAWTDAAIPTATAPNNLIALVWDDWNVAAGEITWGTSGVAPNRKLTVCFNTMGRGAGAADTLNGQIVLEETTNRIILNITKKGVSTNTATQGIENQTGTLGMAVAGRNNVAWSANNNSQVFMPGGGTLTYNWAPSTFLSSTTIVNPMATNITSTTTYTVSADNAGCSSTGTVTVISGSALTSTANTTPASGIICAGNNITLNSVPTGGGAPYTYAWSGPNGFTSTGQNPVISAATVAATGTYTVTVTDNCASTSTSTVSVTVNANPTISVTPATATYCNPGTAVNLTASGSSTSYAWSPSTGLSGTTGANVNANPAAGTTYTVTGTDGNGCSATAVATISSAPAVTINPITATPSVLCAGGNSSLAAVANFAPYTYCTAGATSTSFEKISNVTFGTINNTTASTAGYENQTSSSTNITAGVAVPISIGISSAYANDDRIHVWVDLNNDGVLADPSENVMNLAISTFCASCSGTNTTVTGNITIPVTALNGTTRMRVRLEDASSGGNATPCGTSTYGQVEDYTVNISGATDNPNITYAWSPSTFLSSTTAANVTANAMTSSQTYTLVATATSGCSATASLPVTVNPLPTVMAMSDDADNTVCAGTSVTLSGMGASTYTWTGGVTDAVAFTPTGTATYTVTGTDVNGCMNTATATITVNPLPTVMAMSDDADNAICDGASVTLSGMGATSYSWTGGVSDGVAFTPTGTATYTVTGTDANGCMNTATTTITVNPIPTVTAMSDDADNTVCAGTAVTLTGMGASTYTWTGGVTDAVAFNPAGTATYTVTGTDANGCMNTATTIITVNPLPMVMAMSDNSDNAVCAGSAITLSAMGTATSYTWDNGVTDAVAFIPTSTATYIVTGTDANSCTNTASITITVNALPVVDLGPDFTQCGSATLDAGNAGASFAWSDASTGQTLTVTSTATYSVTVTDGSTGCSASDMVNVTINPLPVVDMAPFATLVCNNMGVVTLTGGSPAGGVYSGTNVSGVTFDPTGLTGMYLFTYTVTDANNCMNSDTASAFVDMCEGVASKENNVQSISVYPNPTEGIFNISISNTDFEQLTINIVDIQGKVVFNETDKNITKEYNKQIDLEGLAKGVYYIKMNTGSDLKIEKLIIH